MVVIIIIDITYVQSPRTSSTCTALSGRDVWITGMRARQTSQRSKRRPLPGLKASIFNTSRRLARAWLIATWCHKPWANVLILEGLNYWWVPNRLRHGSAYLNHRRAHEHRAQVDWSSTRKATQGCWDPKIINLPATTGRSLEAVDDHVGHGQ